jgi:hypothetical protein
MAPMTVRRIGLREIAAAVAWAGGTWCAGGALTVAASESSLRVGALPPVWLLAGALACALAVVIACGLRQSDVLPLWLPAVAVVPWLPLPTPAVALMWVGPLGLLLSAVSLVLAISSRAIVICLPARSHVVAAIVLVLLYLGAAWSIAPRIPGGDEPHYLVITQSLLHDRDLRIENNHQRRDYAAYVEGDLRPDYLRRGRDGAIYSIHAPGVSALILPAFAVAGHRGAVALLAILSALGVAALWKLLRAMYGEAAAFGAAAIGLTTPFVLQAFTIYPDGPAAVVVAAVAWLALSVSTLTWKRALACGLLLAALPWLHTRYAAIAGPLGLVVMARLVWPAGPASPTDDSRWTRLAAFVIPALATAAAWLYMFHAIYGVWDPRAPYGHATDMRLARIPHGLAGLLFDQQFGLLPYAPVYLLAAPGFIQLFGRHRRLALEVLLAFVPYVLAIAGFHMWWGGRSSPARFLVPVLPLLALPLSAWWQSRQRAADRAIGAALLTVSVIIAVALAVVDRGGLVYNSRDGHGLWLLAASTSVNLTYALPSLFQSGPGQAMAIAGGWLAIFAVAWLTIRAIEPRILTAGAWRALVLSGAILSISAGASAGWTISGKPGADVGAGALAVAADACRGGPLVRTGATLALSSKLDNLVIANASRRAPAPGKWVGENVPPGRYVVHVASGLNVSGSLDVALGRPDAVFTSCVLDDQPPGPTSCEIDLPAGARALWVNGDAGIARTAEAVGLMLVAPDLTARCTLRAERVLSGARSIFVVSGRAWVEGSGLWTRGGDAVELAVPVAGAFAALRVRGADDGEVVVESGAWRDHRRLQAGETWDVDVPAPTGGTALVRVATSASFVPADRDPASTDRRPLGVWVEGR